MEVKNVRYHGSFAAKRSDKKISNYLDEALYHMKVMFTGFKRMMYGAATAGAFAIAGYGFYLIPTEGGYGAVCDFVFSTMTLVVAVSCMYAQGKPGNKNKSGKK